MAFGNQGDMKESVARKLNSSLCMFVFLFNSLLLKWWNIFKLENGLRPNGNYSKKD